VVFAFGCEAMRFPEEGRLKFKEIFVCYIFTNLRRFE
jgi:hypothetical protein